MYSPTPHTGPNNIVNELTVENNFLQAQIQTLNGRVHSLEAENAHLRSLVLYPYPPPAAQVHAAPSENALALPTVVETLAVMQDHYRCQGTLRQCSTPGCHRHAFDQICFRAEHMAWYKTHNRIITQRYTSFSVKSEERGDCIPVSWEERRDWQEIVDRAYREGKIGRKGLDAGHLRALFFSPAYTPPRAGPPAKLPQGLYPSDGWA